MAQPESNSSFTVGNVSYGPATSGTETGTPTVTVRVDPAQLASTLEPFKRELKRIEQQARKAAREVAQLIDVANKAGSYNIGFEIEVPDNEEGGS